MKKTLLIIAREYLTRVRKKSFLVMTILGPLLIVLAVILPLYLTMQSEKDVKVLVVDDNDFFINKFEDNNKITFSYLSGDIEELKMLCIGEEYDAVLHILGGNQSNRANLYYFDEPSLSLKSDLAEQMDKICFDKALQDSFHVNSKKFEEIKALSKSTITTLQIDEDGESKKSFSELNSVVGLICGFLIYTFIFMFASQVLRSVLEEKTNRIVEVLISSVKPAQLMLGKIIGIALVGLTQLAIWVVLTLLLMIGVQTAMPDIITSKAAPTEIVVDNNSLPSTDTVDLQTTNLFNEIKNFYSFSFGTLILSFLFFFIFGYLEYATLFAAVGSAVDNETDSQQFTLPVTLPLILTIILVMPIAENPNGTLAFWMSMIPLTSPVAMLIRIPSGVPAIELLSSMAILVLFFIFCLWMASKIYRTGILMYGKKTTYKDMLRWIKGK
ncbi:MAG: ABC transporter permease [Bacteroidales bacterium]|nr:ABC transporter permease [Bacteroidales bacterium]